MEKIILENTIFSDVGVSEITTSGLVVVVETKVGDIGDFVGVRLVNDCLVSRKDAAVHLERYENELDAYALRELRESAIKDGHLKVVVLLSKRIDRPIKIAEKDPFDLIHLDYVQQSDFCFIANEEPNGTLSLMRVKARGVKTESLPTITYIEPKLE